MLTFLELKNNFHDSSGLKLIFRPSFSPSLGDDRGVMTIIIRNGYGEQNS